MNVSNLQHALDMRELGGVLKVGDLLTFSLRNDKAEIFEKCDAADGWYY
jgi:hypothetical protein